MASSVTDTELDYSLHDDGSDEYAKAVSESQVETTESQEKKPVSIFGDLDMDKVPDDPFAIDPRTYRAVVVEADVKTTTKDGESQRTIVIKYAIDEPGDDFHGDNVWDRYAIWPGIEWEDLSPSQKKTTKFLKQRLREGMDMTKEEIANFADPSTLIGKVLYLTIVQNDAKEGNRKFNNVRTALSERLFIEQGGTTSDQASKSTGASVGL